MQLPETINEAKVWALASTVILGALGATASLTVIAGLTWPQKAAMVFYGTVMAALFTDPVVALVNMPPGISYGVAFLVGMFSMTIVGALVTMIRKADLWALVSDIISSWLRRGG